MDRCCAILLKFMVLITIFLSREDEPDNHYIGLNVLERTANRKRAITICYDRCQWKGNYCSKSRWHRPEVGSRRQNKPPYVEFEGDIVECFQRRFIWYCQPKFLCGQNRSTPEENQAELPLFWLSIGPNSLISWLLPLSTSCHFRLVLCFSQLVWN